MNYWTADDLFNVIAENEKQGISATQTLKRLPHGLMVYFGKAQTTDRERIKVINELFNAGKQRKEIKAIVMSRFGINRKAVDRLIVICLNQRCKPQQKQDMLLWTIPTTFKT